MGTAAHARLRSSDDPRHREHHPHDGRATYLGMAKSRHAHPLGGPHLPRPDPPDDRRGSPEALDQPGLTVYAGFDPSADSLHVGSLLQLCTLRRFQHAGHRPISLAGGGTGMIGDPGGKQDERQLLDLETIEGYLEGIRPQLAQFLDLEDDRALLLNNADWLEPALHPRVPARRGQALHRQPDGGQGVSQDPLRAPGPGDLVHRVQLHAAPGLRLPAPSRRLRLRSPVRRQRPVGQHHHGRRLHPQGLRRRGVGVHHAAHREARRDQVRQDRVGHGLARRQADQPLRHVPVLPQHARRAGRRAAPVPHLLGPRGDPRARRRDGGAPAAPRGTAGPRPRRHRARARRGGGGQVRGGLGGALRRGDRGPERGDAARRDRGRADDSRPPRRSCSTASPSSTSSSAPVWPRPRRRRGAPSRGAGPTSTMSGRAMPAAPWARPTSCTTATSCCARAPEGSTSSGPHEAPVRWSHPSCS